MSSRDRPRGEDDLSDGGFCRVDQLAPGPGVRRGVDEPVAALVDCSLGPGVGVQPVVAERGRRRRSRRGNIHDDEPNRMARLHGRGGRGCAHSSTSAIVFAGCASCDSSVWPSRWRARSSPRSGSPTVPASAPTSPRRSIPAYSRRLARCPDRGVRRGGYRGPGHTVRGVAPIRGRLSDPPDLRHRSRRRVGDAGHAGAAQPRSCNSSARPDSSGSSPSSPSPRSFCDGVEGPSAWSHSLSLHQRLYSDRFVRTDLMVFRCSVSWKGGSRPIEYPSSPA